MLNITLYDDLKISAEAFDHRFPAVHINIANRLGRVGYVAISPDQAESLAAELNVVAAKVRSIEDLRAKAAAILSPDTAA